MRHVRRPERDLLAALDAKRHQALSNAVDLLAKLVPREPIVTVGIDDRVILATTCDRLVQELTERIFARYRQVVPGHTRRDRLHERRL